MIHRAIRALIVFFSVLASCHKAPVIDFHREKIHIEIDDGEVRVNGEYFFRNNTVTQKQIEFYYPFPIDSVHSYPHVIMLDYPYEKDAAGIYFNVGMESKESSSFKITYNQRVRKDMFRYITTTTWHMPVKQAEFTISAPADHVLKVNYRVSKKYELNSKWYYYIRFDRFSPDDDLLIEWQCPGPRERSSR